MNRRKFDGQQLSKCPDMIGQSSSHTRCAVIPLGLDQSRDVCLLRQRQTQAHVRPGKVVEGLKEHDTPPHLGAICTEAPAFAHQRRQGMTQREVQALDQTRTDRQPQFLQPPGATADMGHQLLQTPLALLFDHLPLDQLRVRVLYGLLGASRLAGALKGLQGMVDLNESRQITTKTITEKARHPQDAGRRQLYELQGTGKRPGANKRRQDEATLWGKTDPDPLPPVLAPLGACPIWVGLLRMLTKDETPHLVELDLCDRQRPQQMGIDLLRLVGGSSQPRQDGGFGHAPKPMSERATVTRSIFRAMMTLSSADGLLSPLADTPIVGDGCAGAASGAATGAGGSAKATGSGRFASPLRTNGGLMGRT